MTDRNKLKIIYEICCDVFESGREENAGYLFGIITAIFMIANDQEKPEV